MPRPPPPEIRVSQYESPDRAQGGDPRSGAESSPSPTRILTHRYGPPQDEPTDRGGRPHLEDTSDGQDGPSKAIQRLYSGSPSPPRSQERFPRRTITAPGPSPSGEQAYRYKPLRESYIRLLRLFPERRTLIKCEIVHVSLRDPPPYVAVSYAWGDVGDTRKVELDGSLHPIAVSLHGALNALRQRSHPILVWADYLCIDQENTDERTEQVQLMTSIYTLAESVAIWLGPEEDNSSKGIHLLCDLAEPDVSRRDVVRMISTERGQEALAAVVCLFERDYWNRLWVVQEILNAKSITVHCGTTRVPYQVFRIAFTLFRRYRDSLEVANYQWAEAAGRKRTSPNHFIYFEVLTNMGPGGMPEAGDLAGLGALSLLRVMTLTRRKLASDPRDKFFAILGILPEEVRREFRADYSLSIRDVYTEVVDYILKTTQRLDIICQAINPPPHSSPIQIPSFVPDWSHLPDIVSISHTTSFSASLETRADCRFLDERLNTLEISAIYIDRIENRGMATGTLCTWKDYLMSFLQWRAVLLTLIEHDSDEERLDAQQDFVQALSLGQAPRRWRRPSRWLAVCYHVFACLLRELLPHVPLDDTLSSFLDMDVGIKSSDLGSFLEAHFGIRMMGRCFYHTKQGLIGMGIGSLMPGDVVVVPLGCSTPVILREVGAGGEYRFIGDTYLQGFMYGRAVDDWRRGETSPSKFKLR